jgi:hypothetical protein
MTAGGFTPHWAMPAIRVGIREVPVTVRRGDASCGEPIAA